MIENERLEKLYKFAIKMHKDLEKVKIKKTEARLKLDIEEFSKLNDEIHERSFLLDNTKNPNGIKKEDVTKLKHIKSKYYPNMIIK